jgi:hypothetical protein
MHGGIACPAAFISASILALGGPGRCGEAQVGAPAVKAQTSTKAKRLPAGRAPEGKSHSVDNKLPSTGSAIREVVNADFTLVGIGGEVPSDYPRACRITAGYSPQVGQTLQRYRFVCYFRDTATRPECRRYFTRIDRIRAEVRQVRHEAGTGHIPGYVDIAGAGVFEYPLSPVKASASGN